MRNAADRIRAKHQVDRREWYRIENKTNDTATVYLFDEIGYDPWFDVGVPAQDFVKEISEIKAKRIELHINSPGGVAFPIDRVVRHRRWPLLRTWPTS
jgi:ATP-dependent protease ClpP protease subunit